MHSIRRLRTGRGAEAHYGRPHRGRQRPRAEGRARLPHRSFRISLAGLIGALGVAGCAFAWAGDTTAANAAKPAGVLTFGVPGAPTSLNPALDAYSKASMMRYLSNEPILTLRANGSFGPALATKWG